MYKSLIILSLLVFVACGPYSCSPDKRSLQFKDAAISGHVDSLIFYKRLDTKRYFFEIDGVWYSVGANHYVNFRTYVEKGDSVYKAPGRWDIYVYRKQDGVYYERYFEGAQGAWEWKPLWGF